MTTNNINYKCPKCSSNMIEHPSLLSMPLTSLSQNTSSDTKNMSIEDQDANFMFRFNSCKRCGYSEFYLYNGGRTV
jgi:predicted nucleic-acid-binding Zn-ribbon protein